MRVFVLGLLAVLWGGSAYGKTLYTFNGGGTTGNWSSANTWTTDPTGSTRVGQSVPATGDDVVVTNSFTVSVTSQVATSGLKITIQRGGVLDLATTGSTDAFGSTLSRLAGQGTLRIARAYFPAVTTNDFDDANTGTVEFYDLSGTANLPNPASGQYNNVRLLNTTATAYTTQLDNDLTLTGSLTLTRTNTTVTTPLVSFTLGKTANGNRTLTVQGDIAVGAGTALGVTAVTGAHLLSVSGSFVNNGTVNLHNGTTNDNQVALLLFTGATNANFACNGPTALSRLQVNKGIDSQVLLNVTATVAPGGASASNLTLNQIGNGRLLDLVNGVAKFGNNIYLNRIHNGSNSTDPASDPNSGWWTLGSAATSPTLWIDGATIINDNAVLFAIYGTYRISGGKLSSMTPDAMVVREDGQVLIEGGTTSVNKFRPSSTSATHRGSFIMTGGVFESLGAVPFTIEDDFARFSIPYVTQSFRMSGGTLRMQNPSNGDGLFHIGVNTNNAIITGGTIELLLPNSNTIARMSTTAPLWNLTIRKPVAGGSSIAQIANIAVPAAYTSGATITAQPLTVLNNFAIDGTNPTTFDANSKNVTIQGTLNIASGGTYLPGTNTTTFSGGQDQQLVNDGAIGNATTPNTFYNWVVDKSAGTLVLAGAATTYTVNKDGVLSLLNGVLSDNGSTINVLGNMVNSASHTSGGGTGGITLAGSTKQTVSGNDRGVFGNLNINSKLATGSVAAEFTANMTVASALTFQSQHILAIGANRLALTNVSPSDAINGTFSNSCFVQTSGNQSDLGLQKTYGGADNFIFPVGTGTKYAPANVILSVATALAKYGQVSVSPVNSRNPFVTNGTTGSLAYYWKVRSTGFGTIPSSAISMRFTMTNADAAGTLTNYVPGRYAPVAWTPQYTDKNLVVKGDPTSVIRFNSLNQFEGEFTAGLPATTTPTVTTGAFGAVTAYYSRLSGPWADKNTWSTVGFNGAAASAAPSANNPVFIGSASGRVYHTVTVAADGATSGSLVIDRGSKMDVGTTVGHNFGALPDAKIGGSGLLRVSAKASGTAPYTATFPGGDFGSFLQENGGTVEYYTTGVDYTLPTASGSLSLNSYKNLWVDAAAGRTVALPALDLRIFSQLKTGTSTGTGTVLLSTTAAGNLRADSLIAVQAGALRYTNGTARTLTADTDVRVDAAATLDVANSSATTVANTLNVGGSVTNNGTLDFRIGTGAVNLNFTGSQNGNFTGTNANALTDLYTLTLNRGIGQAATLNLDVAGTLNTPSSNWLTLTNGTLRYAKTTGTLGIHDAIDPYLIPSSAGLTVDAPGAAVTVATNTAAPASNTSSTSDLKLAGTLQVLQGSLSVGTVPTGTTTSTGVVGNDLEYASAGAPTIRVGTGGTLYVNGQIRRTTANTNGSLRYDQSGGTVEIRGARAEVYQNNERGLLEVQGPGSIFRMTGGTLALRGTNTRPTIIADLYLRPDSTVVTAGTVLLGNKVSGNITVSVESLVPLYDMQVEAGLNGSSTNTGLLTGVNPLSLKGSLTITNDNAYFNANGLGLSIDRDLINNNASANNGLANGGFQPGVATQTTTFTGKGPVVQQVTSTLSTTANNLTVFGGLVVNNAQTGGTLQLGRNARVIGTLNIAKGTLADNGQTLTSLGNIINTATHTSTGSGSIIVAGPVNQNIDGNGKGKFGNLTINGISGATTLADQEITGVLTLTSGILTIGSNLLSLSNTSASAVTGFNSTNFIRTNGIVADLGVRKSYPAGASNFVFPIGAAAKYTPVRMNVTANAAAGTLTVQPIDLAHPSTTDPAAKELTFYWKVRSTGFSNPVVTQAFTYIDNGVGNDVSGTEANYKVGRFLNGAWVPASVANVGGITTSTVDTGNNTLTNPAATYFDGDYTGGEPSEFGPVPTFYSRNSTAGAGAANWEDPTTWTNNADGSNPTGNFTSYPGLANPVVIRSGHRINSFVGSEGAANLNLQGTLDLGASTANNFNTVTGAGTVRIGSALFPAGNYADFMAPTGGTVDYTAAVQLPARDTYNNLTFSGGNTKLLSNLDLTINGTLSVAANTIVNNPTSQSITLASATSGATVAGTLNLNDGPLTTSAFVSTISGGTLNLGAGQVNIGTSLTNGGTLNNGSGAVTVGTSFLNTGVYNAKAGSGTLAVGTTFTNNGTYNAGTGSLTIGGDFSNAANKSFVANTGNVLIAGGFANAGIYRVADGVSGNLLRVVGDFNNQATGSFAAATSTLVLRGNFTNSNGLNFDTSLGGLVQFINDDSRTLTGTTTFYNMQKVGASSLTLGTSTNVTVANVLTLSNGLLVTGTSNTLKLTNSAVQPIVGTGPGAYVAGRLAITLPTAVSIRVFPVGLGGRYRPVTLKTEDVSSEPQDIITEIINGAPKGTVDATLSNISANRSYRIQRLSGGTLAPISVQLSFNTDVTDEEVHVPGNLRVAQSPNGTGPWSTAGGAGVFSPADPRGYTTSASSQTVLDGVSFFALASTNKVDNPLTGQAPLPVQLLSFTAARRGSAVRTAWATASEKNSAYFVVERSADSRTFGDVQQVTAQGNSFSRHDYAALDTQPLAGTSYYRLRQVDLDGTVAYSPVVAVRLDGSLAAPALVVYPNPTAGQHFQVLATNLATTGGTVQLFDNLGRLVLTQVAAVGTAEALIQPAQTLASGLYFVTWQTADGLKLTSKVVVE